MPGKINLPADIQQFLAQHIQSIHELEMLLLLYAEADKRWTIDMVANHLYIPSEVVEERLVDLSVRNLLRRVMEPKQGSVYTPRDEHHTFMQHLALHYKDRRVTMISFIFSRSDDTIRSFADAFKFRKES